MKVWFRLSFSYFNTVLTRITLPSRINTAFTDSSIRNNYIPCLRKHSRIQSTVVSGEPFVARTAQRSEPKHPTVVLPVANGHQTMFHRRVKPLASLSFILLPS